MKTCTYEECFNAFVSLTGLDGEREDYIASRFENWFNLRLREIWRAARWDFLIETSALIVCKFGWIDLPLQIECADLFEVFDKDFRVDKRAKRLRYSPERGDSIICERLEESGLIAEEYDAQKSYESADVFKREGKFYVVFEGAEVKLSGDIYSQNFLKSSVWGKPALKSGDIVVGAELSDFSAAVFLGENKYVGISDCYIKRSGAIRYKRTNPEYCKEDKLKTLPYAFKNYIAEGARANWLASENRQDEAAAAEAKAGEILEEELYRLECNPYKQRAVGVW